MSIIVAIWFGYRAYLTEKSIIGYAIGGVFLFILVNAIVSYAIRFLMEFGSQPGPKGFLYIYTIIFIRIFLDSVVIFFISMNILPGPLFTRDSIRVPKQYVVNENMEIEQVSNNGSTYVPANKISESPSDTKGPLYLNGIGEIHDFLKTLGYQCEQAEGKCRIIYPDGITVTQTYSEDDLKRTVEHIALKHSIEVICI